MKKLIFPQPTYCQPPNVPELEELFQKQANYYIPRQYNKFFMFYEYILNQRALELFDKMAKTAL